MSLITRLFQKKPKFEGVIVSAVLDSQEIDLSNGKQIINYIGYPMKLSLDHDEFGMPITKSDYVGRYKIQVKNPNGEIKEFHQYGREPKIGSKFLINYNN